MVSAICARWSILIAQQQAGARRLSPRIGELSQRYMAAGWLTDIEFMIWQDLTNRRLVENLLVSPSDTFFPPLDDAEKSELRAMSEAIDI